jgi:hypothetical protein
MVVPLIPTDISIPKKRALCSLMVAVVLFLGGCATLPYPPSATPELSNNHGQTSGFTEVAAFH